MAAHAPVYLDYQATTPVDDRVLQAMLPCFSEAFGNPSSEEHRFGWQAAALVKKAKQGIAASLGVSRPDDLIFTSGATESNNLAILGVMRAYARKGKHLISVKTEHKAVLDPCTLWQREGGDLTLLDVDEQGLLDLDDLAAAIREDTVLISVMAANNEIGVLQPIREIGAMARERGILFHTDAAQAVGKVPLHVDLDNIDMLSLSTHKIYGPKGVGLLFVRSRNPRVGPRPLIHGGGQQKGLRSGTLNVPGIVATAEALALCMAEMEAETKRLTALRDHFLRCLTRELDGVSLNGHPHQRLPGNLNLSFDGVSGSELLGTLSDIAVSSRSACTSASGEPSHVIRALGVSSQRAAGAVRFGLGRFTTQEDIDYAAARVIAAVKKQRQARSRAAVIEVK